jgi:NAD(P)-dependent dehydrogenase (short-subunit alcohol dehydrogenase family)
MRFGGKVALITGGNSGIGRAAALAFAREGAAVAVAARRAEEGESVAAQVRALGAEAIFIKTDVSNSSEVQAMVERTVDAFGAVDIAFNNAGRGGGGGDMHEVDESTYDAVMDVNVRGVWLCMQAEIRQMLTQGDGGERIIVNCASVAGLTGVRGGALYSATKHAVAGITASAALEYVRRGIRINSVCPGYVDTPMVRPSLDDPERGPQILRREPIGRVGEPAEIASAVLWLCSDGASFMVGHNMPVDGGIMA